MSDLIIEGAGGITDGLYVIKDGEMFKYKPNGGIVYTARAYHVTDRPRGEWEEQEDDYHHYWECSECGMGVGLDDIRNFCPNCGADMRSE